MSHTDIRKKLDIDAVAFEQNDSACKILIDLYLAYRRFYNVAMYRLSNLLVQLNISVLPRMMSDSTQSLTCTYIHSNVTIGHFLDHATGIVIGKTTFMNVIKLVFFQVLSHVGVHVKKN